MNFLRWLFEAQVPLAGSVLTLREVLGNIFGSVSAPGGTRRRVWAWPVGRSGVAVTA
jgi:nicotinamide mononucleotide transporter